MNSQLGILYHTWQHNDVAAKYALDRIRAVYPTIPIFLLMDVIDTSAEYHYHTVVNYYKDTFGIANVAYYYLNQDNIGHFHHQSCKATGMTYVDTLLDHIITLIPEHITSLVYMADDTYIFKEIPISSTYDTSATSITNIPHWEPPSVETTLLEYFPTKTFPHTRLWINHGDYFNIQKIKKIFTKENRTLINTLFYDIGPFPDYYVGLWAALSEQSAVQSSHILNVRDCTISNYHHVFADRIANSHASIIHGYKGLYSLNSIPVVWRNKNIV